MKKIIMSLATIAAVVTMSVASTGAYFSDTKEIANNTFATGTVKIGAVSPDRITVTNLIPGIAQNFDISTQYDGTTNADLFVGAKGTTAPGQPGYLADRTYVKIYDRSNWAVVWEGYVQNLSTGWAKIATNISGGAIKDYRLEFTLDWNTPNSYQGVTNSDTVVVLHAVQTGYPAPAPLYP